MANHIWQRELRRSKTANRVGVILMVTLILILVLSVLNGVFSLGA